METKNLIVWEFPFLCGEVPGWDWPTSKVNARKVTLNPAFSPAFSGKLVHAYKIKDGYHGKENRFDC
ncbi:MAG: hypothetical protein BBJ57_05960 [Desulfobacterales bacterium PC51MH44]|nr:MAG: hypothetical protein BBJ57_05960 [Desulfobacterales bacterium PC51MH44]